jgi:hypothetical protein
LTVSIPGHTERTQDFKDEQQAALCIAGCEHESDDRHALRSIYRCLRREKQVTDRVERLAGVLGAESQDRRSQNTDRQKEKRHHMQRPEWNSDHEAKAHYGERKENQAKECFDGSHGGEFRDAAFSEGQCQAALASIPRRLGHRRVAALPPERGSQAEKIPLLQFLEKFPEKTW